MVKHVYYKKSKRPVVLSICSRKMEQVYQNQLIVEYIKVKYPIQYEEAREYYTSLYKMYPTVRDLRKTWRFRDFKATTKSSDSMILEIPLTKAIPKEAKETLECHEATSVENNDHILPEAKETISEGSVEKIDDIFPDIDMATLVSEIPPQLVDEMIKDLRADPNLAALMSAVEEQVDNDSDIDVDIEIQDDLLEKELFW